MRCVQLKNGSKFAQVPLAKTEKEIQRERERVRKRYSLPLSARYWVLTWQAVKFIKRKTIIKAK